MFTEKDKEKAGFFIGLGILLVAGIMLIFEKIKNWLGKIAKKSRLS